VFLAQYETWFGIAFFAQLLPLSFDKTPLQMGALLWYLSIVQVVMATTSLAWNRLLACTRAADGLALLGRHSLLVYVAHVFTEVLVMEYVWSAWPPALVRTGLAVADIVLLGFLCAMAERRPHMQAWQSLAQRHRQIAWRWQALGAAAACTIALAVLLPRDAKQLEETAVFVSAGPEFRGQMPIAEMSIEGPPEVDQPSAAPAVDVDGPLVPQLFEEPLASDA
jgi:hypothetical protein